MKRTCIVLSAVVLFAACASTGTPKTAGAMPPVNVIVTSAPLVSDFVRTEYLTLATKEALGRVGQTAGPSTIVVHFTELASVRGGDVVWFADTTSIRRGTYPAMSTDPWNERVWQLPEQHFIPGTTQRPVVRGTYAIKDVNGVVLEQKPIYIEIENKNAYPARVLSEQRPIAEFLARRTAALTQKRNG